MRRVPLLLLFPSLTTGHGNCVYPPAWWDQGGKYTVAPGGSCAPGCDGKKPDCQTACMWYSNYTMLTGDTKETTAVDPNSSLRTYMDINLHPVYPQAPDHPVDIYHMHPWRHPGKAPIWSPCGIAGGNPNGCGLPKGQRCPDGGTDFGPDARYYQFDDVITTTWKVGQVVEAAWGITANHGGGYQYRLCPTHTAKQPPGFPLDETCFQAHVMDFVGDKQWLQFGNNRSSRKLFGDLPVRDTKTGTWPVGSTWRRNPIPACKGPGALRANERGGGNQSAYPNKNGTYSCSADSFKGGVWEGILEGPQFEPPGGYPGKYAKEGIYTYGFGNNEGDNTGGPFLFSIVDLLQVPKDLDPGQYVLSFRYDCEQTTQVWSSCHNIRIVPANSTEPDGALIPDGPTGVDLHL